MDKTKPYLVTAPGLSGLDQKPPVFANGKPVNYELGEVCLLTDAGASAIGDSAALHIEPAELEEAPAAKEPYEAPTMTPIEGPASEGENTESPAASGEDDAAASPVGGPADGGGDTNNAPEGGFDPALEID